jgi:hypothetical protein
MRDAQSLGKVGEKRADPATYLGMRLPRMAPRSECDPGEEDATRAVQSNPANQGLCQTAPTRKPEEEHLNFLISSHIELN